MLVSIIIPTFNRLELLKRAVASVETQSFCDYELIIVDDCSIDDTSFYLQTLSHTIITHDSNQGVSASRNSGIKQAKGKYIAFLDSDDVWCRDKLQSQIDFHQENEHVLCSFGIEKWFRNNQEVKRPKKYLSPSKVEFSQLLRFTFIGPSSFMIEKSVLDRVGLFDEKLVVCEDFDLWLRISLSTPLYLSEKTIIEKHAGNYTQLSQSVLTLEPYRVLALLKHQKEPAVAEVIKEKLAIIHKGAIKHQNEELLAFVKEHHVI